MNEVSAIEPDPRGQEDPGYIRIRRSHLYLALVPIAFGIGIAYGYLLWGRGDATPAETVAGSSRLARVEVEQGDDPALGPADAPITIVEFSDFNCPHCQRWHREVSAELFATYPDQIRFIYKDFPIVGGGSVGFATAHAANCAREQDAYWEYHNAMFSGAYPLDPDGFAAASEDLGLDTRALMECFGSERYVEEIQGDFQYGVSLGINGTPTFFINGIALTGAQPLVEFTRVINAELGE